MNMISFNHLYFYCTFSIPCGIIVPVKDPIIDPTKYLEMKTKLVEGKSFWIMSDKSINVGPVTDILRP